MRGPRPVTTLRKSGRLDEAFQLASEQAAAPGADDWDLADLAWCLIALVKRHASDRDQTVLRNYLGQLSKLKVPADNDLLIEQRERALALADSDRREVMAARALGKDGRHADAVRAFSSLSAQGLLTTDDKVAYGWELFRASQAVFKAAVGTEIAVSAVNTIKRHLNMYLKLGIAEQGLLHTCMLQQAERLSRSDHLRLIAFARLWDLGSFRPEDFRESRHDDGKVFPPLFETVIQRASKEAANGGSPAEMRYISPYLEDAMKRFPENVWLKLNMVKLLRALDQTNEARQLATEFARSKASEYWTWELVGDLEADPAMRLSCYAKALTCSDDDTFVTKVRLKFAALIAADYPGQAKAEVERVIGHRQREGTRIPPDAELLAQTAWFAAASPVVGDRAFYDRFKGQAEELLFAHLPWTDASVGDEFVIKGQDGQKDRRRRRLYVRATPLTLEISVSASHPDVRRLPPGTPIKVQTETPPKEPWKTTVHRIQTRPDGGQDDVLTETLGVIDHINHAKGVLHFVVARGVDGTLPIAQFPDRAKVGQAITVRMARYHDRKGPRTRALSAVPSKQVVPPSVLKSFSEHTEVRNGLGFTSNGIFIPPDVVASAAVYDGAMVNGVAVINFDKKRGTWGWKAISAESAGPNAFASSWNVDEDCSD
ncbi:DUF7017 domain-containing protein [Sphingobium yanoikuyae]|uniref:Uncharacterized protein n=1 Tax=Sphingobium yanoikuyae TaxID=13690 RepID=A0A430BLF1_SPHYA|nr:tetratricopeptide repeat protein [Sphingobium yanoikuyae]RSU52485.1 hypothetical protein DAH51_21240 [Sphingobium yanoikuyae]